MYLLVYLMNDKKLQGQKKIKMKCMHGWIVNNKVTCIQKIEWIFLIQAKFNKNNDGFICIGQNFAEKPTRILILILLLFTESMRPETSSPPAELPACLVSPLRRSAMPALLIPVTTAHMAPPWPRHWAPMRGTSCPIRAPPQASPPPATWAQAPAAPATTAHHPSRTGVGLSLAQIC